MDIQVVDVCNFVLFPTTLFFCNNVFYKNVQAEIN